MWLINLTLGIAFLKGSLVLATLSTNETTTSISVKNDRLSVLMTKSSGKITAMSLDGFDLLGSSGTLYTDCQCVPSGFYTFGSSGHTNSTLAIGQDATGTDYAGLIVSDVYTPTGQIFQQFWFLRDGETGLHSFTRLAYYNETTPFVRNIGELRTLFRPVSNLYSYLTTNEHTWAPLPSADAIAKQVVAQDATWWLGNTPNDGYFSQFAEYFTKYTFSQDYRDQKAHGMFIDGSETGDKGYGAWLVMNNKETYFGGPLHSDLLVDGIVYDYIVSGHHGNDNPNTTSGLDRTFGPKYYYFNAIEGAGHDELRADAEQYASPTWNTDFYDSITHLVPNLVDASGRGSFKALITLPKGATNAIAILTVTGHGHQDNSQDTTAYQYWADVTDGSVEIPRVKAGKYRLTVFAEGVFGEYIEDNIEVQAGEIKSVVAEWQAETAGKELWRLGTPDKSSGEFKHGNTLDTTHERQPEEYRVYWGAYNFTEDFPGPVNFTIGESDEAEDWNYVQWSVFGPTYKDPKLYVLNNNWTIGFDLEECQIPSTESAQGTFTIQLAGVKTASGNTDAPNGEYSNLKLSTYVNSNAPLEWTVLWYQSSSCAVRSAVSCYLLANKLTFPASWLHAGRNEIVLSIPYNATDIETAILPTSVYIQYDALRLEVDDDGQLCLDA